MSTIRRARKLRPRGPTDVKGKGPMTPCLLLGRRAPVEPYDPTKELVST